MTILKVEWDREAAGIVQQRLEGLRGAQQRQAMRFALADVTRWAATQAVRGLSAAKSIPQKVIRRRVFSRLPTAAKLNSEVWVGVGGVRAIDIGPARQTKAGVYISTTGGRLSLPHAFIRTMPNGHVGVFRFPASKYSPSRLSRGRKGRVPNLPIEEVKVALQPEAERIIRALQSEAGPRLQELVARKIQQFIDSGKAPSE